MKRILFVCTGNTCRSPMAQAHFIKLLQNKQNFEPEEFEVLSAGLFASDGMPASSFAIKALLLEDINLSNHRSLQINRELIEKANLIITMTGMQCNELRDRFPDKKENIHSISDLVGSVNGDVLDPFGMGIEAYITTSQQLKELLEKLINNIHNYLN